MQELKKHSKITNIVLDLDSTVINSIQSNEEKPNVKLPFYLMIDDDNPDEVYYIVYERPHLQKFLDYIFKFYNVGVWTAASKDYAIFIVENILLQNKPERKLEFLLFDYHVKISENMPNFKSTKDLNLIWKNFNTFTDKNTIIVDDYSDVFMPQLGNAYPIPPFIVRDENAESDTELLKLMRKLSASASLKHHDTATASLITKETLIKAIDKVQMDKMDEDDDGGDDGGDDELEQYNE